MTQDSPTATDPVCGMTVDRDTAVRAGLTAEHAGVIYYFCAKGCQLEFGDDPAAYLHPDHRPSM